MRFTFGPYGGLNVNRVRRPGSATPATFELVECVGDGESREEGHQADDLKRAFPRVPEEDEGHGEDCDRNPDPDVPVDQER